MHNRKKNLLFVLVLLVAVLALSACQNSKPATVDTPPTEKAPDPAAAPDTPAPTATQSATDDAFQETVDPTMGKVLYPPEAPDTFAPAERPNNTIGKDSATLTMYEWCDYGYPNCIIYANDILPKLQEKYVDTGKLRIVHKEFPAAGGDPSVIASLAAQCASYQDHFIDMSKWLYRDTSWNTGEYTGTVAAMNDAASAMGLDTDAFATCMEKQESLEDVKADYFEARDLEFRDLPGVVVGGRVIQNGVSTDDLMTIIDAILQEKESGTLPDTVVTVTPSPTPDTDFEPEAIAVMGSPDAPVTIVEFTDYQCPYCQRYSTGTLPEIIKNYVETGKVRYILKNFPLTQIHPNAIPAATAAECAGEQGKYWEMHDIIFHSQQEWSSNASAAQVFADYAKNMGLDTDDFESCFNSTRYAEKIMNDQKEGLAAGVQGTPAFFINGQFINGAQPYEVFQQIIEQQLEK